MPESIFEPTTAVELEARDLSVLYGETRAVKSISIKIPDRQVVAFIGPSGCGKSTLLRLAAGVERPQAGRVLLDGSEVAGPKAFVPPEQRNIGLMFQDFALFPHLTILANVAFGLRALDRAAAKREALSALRRVGLEPYEASYPHELSGGMQQRAAIARALVHDPKLILMDEPFGALDALTREKLQATLLDIWQQVRATVLFVTHSVEEAVFLADRVVVMTGGPNHGVPGHIAEVVPVDLALAPPRDSSSACEAVSTSMRRPSLSRCWSACATMPAR